MMQERLDLIIALLVSVVMVNCSVIRQSKQFDSRCWICCPICMAAARNNSGEHHLGFGV